jgi:hypothetical protein
MLHTRANGSSSISTRTAVCNERMHSSACGTACHRPRPGTRLSRSQVVECPDLPDESQVVATLLTKLARCLRDFCVFGRAVLCSVVPNATGATRNLLIKSKLNFRSSPYEPPASVSSVVVPPSAGQEQLIPPETQSSPTGMPTEGLDDYLIAQVLHQLTKLVGPIAPILVKKARKQAGDFNTFSQLIAERLDPKERRQLLEAVAAIQQGRFTPSSSHPSG